MLVEELIKAVYDIVYKGTKLKTIEQELKMPVNSLSGMLNGSRPFAKKWIVKLEQYVKMSIRPAAEQNNLSGNKERILEEREGMPDRIQEKIEATYPALTDADIFEVAQKAQKSPPPGLTKAQQIRWHRENTQTLQ